MNRQTIPYLAAVAAITAGAMLWPASAQPGAGSPPPDAPRERQRGDRPGPGGGPGGERGPRSEWAEQYRQELREHPRLARAIVALHEAKDYIEKSPENFGGNKAAAIKAADETLKQLKEVMKFDPKREPRQGPGEGRDGKKPDGDKKPNTKD